ncbi:MAG TPA: MFS transporter [Gemmataceae bacterium]|jgi:nucleoside transporter|nr:MFS transporter [Gemmataceae bacterium]
MATESFGEPASGSMSSGVRFRLSVMMFLQFFIWGAWFELGFDYIPTLGFNKEWQQPLVFGAFNVGALVALFFSTQFADRKFAAERFLAVSHFIGGLAILLLFFLPGNKENPAPFWPFFALMLVHSIFYVPTISITNSIAFANLSDPARQFGPVRLWGTIGWIAASWPFIFILVDWARVPAIGDTGGIFDWIGTALGTSKAGADASSAQRYIFLVAGAAALLLALISPALPHTPPKPAAAGADSLAWVKAIRLLKHPFVAVLFLVTFIDAAVHQSFFYWTASFLKTDVGIKANWVTPVMKIGQLAEIITMLFLGFVLKRLGWRMTMVLGVLGHAGRFAVFAFWPEPAPAVLINVLHGICYAFFFATVYIFVDEYFPKDVRSSAQGLFNVLILGVGPFLANFACGRLGAKYTAGDKLEYSAVFVYSLGAALIGALILALFFHPTKPAEDPGFSRAEEDAPPVA